MKLVDVYIPGARMHYAVPRICESNNILSTFYTDFFTSARIGRALDTVDLRCLNRVGRLLKKRAFPAIPDKKVVDFKALALMYYAGRRVAVTDAEIVRAHLNFSKQFCKRCASIHSMGRVKYALNSTALEIFQSESSVNTIKILEQCIAPKFTEIINRKKAHEIYPEWYPAAEISSVFYDYAARERVEWELANLILAPSRFVEESLQSLGVSPSKIRLVPYGVESIKSLDIATCQTNEVEYPLRVNSNRKLKILFVGEFGLRKGAPLVVSLAKLFPFSLEIRIAGVFNKGASYLKDLPSSVKLLGQISSTDLQREYQNADLLLLPSLCEGSATVTYEALVQGKPIVCTKQSGAFIDHLAHGLVFDFFDHQGLCAIFERILSDQKFLENMQQNVLVSRARWSLDRYEADLSLIFDKYAGVNESDPPFTSSSISSS